MLEITKVAPLDGGGYRVVITTSQFQARGELYYYATQAEADSAQGLPSPLRASQRVAQWHTNINPQMGEVAVDVAAGGFLVASQTEPEQDWSPVWALLEVVP